LLQPIIILENPKYLGNVGMICRLIGNFDLEPLRILGQHRSDNFEMEWMAHGALEEIEKIKYYETFLESRRDIEIVIGTGMIHGRDRGRFISISEIPEIVQNSIYSIVFGREDTGLKKATVEACDFMIDFRLPGQQKSMNLSHSVNFVLASLHSLKPRKEKQRPKPNVSKNYFYEYAQQIFSILEMNNFHGSQELALKRFKSILERANPNQGDINFLFKIFRNIENLKKQNGYINEE
jgi:TrmH family RNA methyltransferase